MFYIKHFGIFVYYMKSLEKNHDKKQKEVLNLLLGFQSNNPSTSGVQEEVLKEVCWIIYLPSPPEMMTMWKKIGWQLR